MSGKYEEITRQLTEEEGAVFLNEMLDAINGKKTSEDKTTTEELIKDKMKRQDVWDYHIFPPDMQGEPVVLVKMEYGKNKKEATEWFKLYCTEVKCLGGNL